MSLRDVEKSIAAKLASRPRIVSLQPNSLADIWADIRRVAESLGIETRGERCVADLQYRMETTSRRARNYQQPARLTRPPASNGWNR